MITHNLSLTHKYDSVAILESFPVLCATVIELLDMEGA